MLTKPTTHRLYSVGVWDVEKQSYVPCRGLSVCPYNIPIGQLRQALRELRKIGYTAHRKREDGSHKDNDPSVIVERTDGESALQIRRGWRR